MNRFKGNLNQKKGIIKKSFGRANYFTYYIDYNNNRYWYASGYQRTTIWRSQGSDKEIKVLIYPCYPFMDNYLNKEVKIKEILK